MKSGTLRDHTIAEIIRDLYKDHIDGVLTVRQDDVEKQIFFAYGSPIFATSNQRDDRMGAILYRQGKVSREDLVKAVEKAKATGKRFGTILVESGLISPEELVQTVIVQVEDIILSVFCWEDGEYRFLPGPVPTEDIVALNLNPADLILKGVKEKFSMTQVDRFLGNLDQILHPVPNPDQLYPDVQLSPFVHQILALMDGMRPLSEIVRESQTPPEETLRTLAALKILELVYDQSLGEVPPPPTPAGFQEEGIDAALSKDIEISNFKEETESLYSRLASMNYYELLGVSRKAEKQEIVKCYTDLSRKFHPDRFQDSLLQDISDKALEIFNQITFAYTTLSNDRSREEYNHSLEKDRIQSLISDETLDPAEARRHYERGMILYQEGDLRGAQQAFDLAVSIDPSVSEYHTGLGLLQAMESGDKPANIAEAERCFKKAIALNADEPRNYFYLGQIHKSREEYPLAREYFRKALEKRPNYPQARAELKKIEAL